ncbi:MAG: hypothetical protein PHF23_01720 [Smithellaceae bacterium]|nr:hypothetical protein [Smithellaceae bacterium]
MQAQEQEQELVQALQVQARQAQQVRRAQQVRQARLRVVLLWRALALVRLRRQLQLWPPALRLVLLRHHHHPIRPRLTQLRLTLNRLSVWKNIKRRKQAARGGPASAFFMSAHVLNRHGEFSS